MQSLLPKRHRRILIILFLVVVAALLFPSEQSSPSASQRQSIDLSAASTNTQSADSLTPQIITKAEPSIEQIKVAEQLKEAEQQPSAKSPEVESVAKTPQPSQAAATELVKNEPAPEANPETHTLASEQGTPLTAKAVIEPDSSGGEVNLNDAAAVLEQIQQGNELHLGVRYPLELAIKSDQTPLEQEHFYTLKRQTVKSGDSMALIFSRVGLSARTLHNIDQLGGEARKLRTVHPGDTLDFYLDDNDQLIELHYPQSKYQTLIIERDSQDQFSARIDTQELETRTNFARGTINSSFWNAGISAELSQGQIMDLAAVFGWDIDFALDIRKNDSFMVLFEELYVDGQYAGNGDIIAAEFINQGDVFRAVRHDDGNYYTPEGRPMRKAFLRAPVNFKYISSSFNPRRLHPVTGRVRAHNGIDYAAKVGTPVQAAGDGRVTKSGYSKYNGNYVFIQHSSAYVTKYLHLHKRYVKTGQRVKQGKKIGTVGATGRVTGPHLHYEFLVHGVHKNPRTVKLPTSTPLKGEQKQRFMPIAKARIEQLDNTKRVLLAMN
ncbi:MULTISPECIES: peptidoglycan DD-metalloendopeptidase family protein [unclassified Agarivorans]|uniref:peptidoglycan DD-metalloendopeptidase family protein n=1 Tax=unclassified Agarivorans TaxID=2636026 RepID=UPI0026E3055C|nr:MULTISPECIES: peptidoglycan DD-metalloendopeptidase family protein [unclassified Agarivorans]MDO6685359.1 peptidoglycan DD-metalloendopeptidase family protein [Agarivorans sp. 3_MG-2023]MDO6715469.1 peptidoglycan DD-metalloendopeptidase family protein [Agarivorans sp. 2_MG-2023]